MKLLLIAFVIIAFIQPGLAQETNGETPENTELQIRLLVDHSLPAEEALRRRLLTGENLQAIATIAPGRLLDPDSVEVKWGEITLPTFVHYKNPAAAVIFAIPTLATLEDHPETELSMTAKLVGSDDLDAGWRLPISLSPENLIQLSTARQNQKGRRIYIHDDKGAPLSSAFVFGQRRNDMFTSTDTAGAALMTAPTRNAASPHIAWADGFFTTAFDPVSSPTIGLVPFLPDAASNHMVDLVLLTSEDKEISAAILNVGERYFLRYPEESTIEWPAALGRVQVTVVSVEAPPQVIDVEPGSGAQRFTLRSLEEMNALIREASKHAQEADDGTE